MEENNIMEQEAPQTEATLTSEEELQKAVEEQMSKLRTQSMLLGGQAICSVILQKIVTAKAQPGKRSLRDYERLVKDIEQFCTTGLSRKVNPDGTTSPVEDNTKLTEE